jgi:hypothetical protein
MTMKCTVCAHPDRADIDAALVGADTARRRIASQYSLVETSLRRHEAMHIPVMLADAVQREREEHATSLLERVGELEVIAHHWHVEAVQLNIDAKSDEKSKTRYRDRAAAIQVGSRAARTIGGVLELLGRVTGELRDRQIDVNVLVASPEWASTRSRIVDALEPYPEAREAVLRALAGGAGHPRALAPKLVDAVTDDADGSGGEEA